MQTVSARIKQFNSDRIPEYAALKYSMMAGNAFRFFRGTCHLFYEDLARHDVFADHPLSWICGDLHLENFGSYKGNNRLVYFDLNDYDEAVLAPATWEIVRMVTSIFTGFESLQISKAEATRVAKLFLQKYSATLANGKALYIEPQVAVGIVKKFLDQVCERKQKTLVKQRALLKPKENKKPSFIISAKLFGIKGKEKKELIAFLRQWLRANKHLPFPVRVLDAGFRIAGTGSVGVKRYVFLVQNAFNQKKFGLIDMKQAKPSSVQPYLKIKQPSWNSEAERVVGVQQRMQNVPPALLGTAVFKKDTFVIKELQPTSDKIDFLLIKDRYKDIAQVIHDMATLTASAQLRSSGRQGSANADELIAFGQNTSWHQQLLDYAITYAAQVKKDYRSFLKDYRHGYFS
ncbi:MAG: DUF2252 family protein [Bacteroidetes bacterium]|nr:DUF2252 family protein [Bacteroidota bacterium]